MKKANHKLLLAVWALILVPGFAWASGAVQRRQGVNVHRKVRVTPAKTGVTFQEPMVVPEEEKKEQPKVRLPPSPQQNVLTSTVRSAGQASRSTVVSTPSPTVSAPAGDQSGFYEEMARLFSRLDQSSEVWTQISDMRVKMLTVSRYIELFQQQGVRITKPALYYAQLIDVMARQDPSMLANPFTNVLRAVAIMEYDFDNGTSKDALARSLLSGQAYIANRRRLGLQ